MSRAGTLLVAAALDVLVGEPPARAHPVVWMGRLIDRLEARLAEERIEEQTIWDRVPYSDGVSAAHLRRNRDALLAAIADARARFVERAAAAPR